MPELRRILLAALLAALPAATPAAPRIYAELAPLAWLAARLTGDPQDVRTLVPPGHSPELYAPTPRQVAAALDADLYLRCGILGSDASWVAALRADAGAPRIIECCRGATDPHAWTDPLQALQMAERMLEALRTLDAAHAARYRQNHHGLERELRALDRRIATLLTPLPQRHFLVAHPSWGAFAARYDLRQHSLEPAHAHGGEPSPQRIAAVIELGRTHGIRAVFVQPGFDHRGARTVAASLDVPVHTLDPLHADYAANLQRVAERLARTLR